MRPAGISAALGLWLWCGGAVSAEVSALPDLQTCMNAEVARYERALARIEDAPTQSFEIGGTGEVWFCGVQGIVRCDRGSAPLACQRGLTRRVDRLTGQVQATLPPPERVAGRAGRWSDGLYPQVWALMRGTSAGPDCAGDVELRAVWCETMEAIRRLEVTMLLWQLARFLEAAPEAGVAGWADDPPPMRPVARRASADK